MLNCCEEDYYYNNVIRWLISVRILLKYLDPWIISISIATIKFLERNILYAILLHNRQKRTGNRTMPMRRAINVIILSLLILSTISCHVFAEQLSSWGSIKYTDSEGFRLESSFKIAFPINRFRIYLNFEIYQSSKREQYWNNKITPAYGMEYNLPFTLLEKAEWQHYTIGGKGQILFYTDNDNHEVKANPYFNWGFGGRFNEFLPYSSWGYFKYTDIDGLLLETAYKQAFKINRVVPYCELGLAQSSIREHYWNNKVTVFLGIEYVLPINLFAGWEDYRTGIKAGYDISTDDDIIEFTLRFYFFNWDFGGISLIERTF